MTIGVIALILLALLVAGVFAGRSRFRLLVRHDVESLFADADVRLCSDDVIARWPSLPEPVRRHLRYALPSCAGSVRTARLKHDGQFRTKPESRWFPIRGEEYFTIGKPGFVWRASIRMAPLLWIEARDRLFSRRGNMLVKLLSSFPIADAKGPEIDQGSALRWLAEAVWFPLGFAGGAVRWEPIGERSARAAIDCGELSGSLVFEIDEEGKFAWMRGNRYRDLGNGKLELTAWVGRCLEYREFDVFRAPSSVEVSWQLEDGLFTYARFQVTGIEYNVARQF